jgi:hypothetical protein
MVRPGKMYELLENGVVNLAFIVGWIVILIGTIPAVLLLTNPGRKKSG